MKDATKRSILRWIHIVFSIPILGYIYSPFEETSKVRRPCSVCRCSCNAPFGTLDVERPCPSTAYFEETGRQDAAVETTRMKTGQEFEA